MNSILQKIYEIGIVPVVKLDTPEQALPLGKALIAGDLPVAEVTFRTAAAEESIKILSKELPDMLIGAGTVLTVEQAKKAVAAGAKFLVSPGFNPEVVKYAVDNNVPITPGVNSPSQIEQGLSMGLNVLKFFPAEQSGGLAMIKALSGPYVNVSFIPTGGIDAKNMNSYLAFKKIIAVGGSWMVKSDLISNGQFDKITELAREAVMNSIGFELRHVGINEPDADSSLSDAKKVCGLFGLALKEGNSSNFAGTMLEFMKKPYLGKNGHIAIAVNNVDRAVALMKRKYDIDTIADTEKRDKDGALTVAYLDIEIGGFAFHFVKK